VVLAFLRFYSSFPQEIAFCHSKLLRRGPIMPLVAASKKLIQFDPKTFLSTINGGGRKIAAFSKKQTIFVQGDSSDAVFYIQKGKVKLTVVSKIGKEATIGILNEGSFLGEGCLTGQTFRLCSATALTDCSLMRIDKKSMVEVLHRESAFSEMFVAYLLARNIRYEEDLVDQLFNSSEKRLARILLLLAHFGKEGVPGSMPDWPATGGLSAHNRFGFHGVRKRFQNQLLRTSINISSLHCGSQRLECVVF
jgi:CRP/FNR family transcriptional regulator, cyclic AMP receptor protein